MTMVNSAITATVALLGVLLGGYISIRNQDRLWVRDHARQWRDIRLSTYQDFLSAYRQFIAFTHDPAAKITALPHPRQPDTLMPFFDEIGRPYRERLDAASIAARLVSQSSETTDCVKRVTRCAREIAASRGAHGADDMQSEAFERLWLAQDALLVAFRRELGLTPSPSGSS